MAIFIDRKYILILSPRLSNFKTVKTDLYNFRCPYCNDSIKNKSKARGYIYLKGGKYFYLCHNCGIGRSLKNFIEFIDPELSKEYSLENFKERINNTTTKVLDSKSASKFTKPKPIFNLPKISSLDNNNKAKKYVINRQLPESTWNSLYYAENFKEFVESVSEKRFKPNCGLEKPRLIIPFLNRNKELIAFQGRALDDFSIRYVTIKLIDEPKIFGADKIDITKKILVVEGPIDALFLDNCIATADSNLAFAATVFDKSNLILIPDVQPRNSELLRQINEFIENGYTISLLPKTLNGKDINDYIKNGLTKEELQNIIYTTAVSGLRAKLEFLKWKEI